MAFRATATSLPHNIQPVIPISISKNWNLILRTIVPIVSQHDLFFIPNLPKNSPRQPQNRSQDGLSDTLQSFFFSPKIDGRLERFLRRREMDSTNHFSN